MKAGAMTDRRRVLGLALTATVFLSLGCSAWPFPRASVTPTPTETATATTMPTQTASPIPRPTITPTASAGPGPATRTLADSSTELTDPEPGYSLVLPPGWIVLILGAEATQSILDAAGEVNPELAWMFEGFGADIAQGMRFMAVDPNAGTDTASYPPTISLVTLDNLRIPLALLLETTAQSLETLIPGADVLSQEIVPDLNGQPAARIEMLLDVTTLDRAQVTARTTLIMLVSGRRLLELTLQSEQSRYPVYEPVFEQVIQSLTLLPE